MQKVQKMQRGVCSLREKEETSRNTWRIRYSKSIWQAAFIDYSNSCPEL